MIIFSNAGNTSPIHGLEDDILGITYRIGLGSGMQRSWSSFKTMNGRICHRLMVNGQINLPILAKDSFCN